MPLQGRPLHVDTCTHCRHITQGLWRQPPPTHPYLSAYLREQRCAHCEHLAVTEHTGTRPRWSIRRACDHCAHHGV